MRCHKYSSPEDSLLFENYRVMIRNLDKKKKLFQEIIKKSN